MTKHIGDGWITDLSEMSKLKKYVDDPKALAEFAEIKYQNKLRLAEYIRNNNGIEIDPRSIFDVQVKRLHEYKRQFLNILHVMYLYNQIKDHPEMYFYPRTFIFGAKAAAGYVRAKETIKLINSVADVINNDKSINGKIKSYSSRTIGYPTQRLSSRRRTSVNRFYSFQRGVRYRKHEIHA